MRLPKRVVRHEFDGPHPYYHYLVVGNRYDPDTWYLRFKKVSGKLDRASIKVCWEALHEGTTSQKLKYRGPGKEQAIQKLREIIERTGENS